MKKLPRKPFRSHFLPHALRLAAWAAKHSAASRTADGTESQGAGSASSSSDSFEPFDAALDRIGADSRGALTTALVRRHFLLERSDAAQNVIGALCDVVEAIESPSGSLRERLKWIRENHWSLKTVVSGLYAFRINKGGESEQAASSAKATATGGIPANSVPADYKRVLTTAEKNRIDNEAFRDYRREANRKAREVYRGQKAAKSVRAPAIADSVMAGLLSPQTVASPTAIPSTKQNINASEPLLKDSPEGSTTDPITDESISEDTSEAWEYLPDGSERLRQVVMWCRNEYNEYQRSHPEARREYLDWLCEWATELCWAEDTLDDASPAEDENIPLLRPERRPQLQRLLKAVYVPRPEGVCPPIDSELRRRVLRTLLEEAQSVAIYLSDAIPDKLNAYPILPAVGDQFDSTKHSAPAAYRRAAVPTPNQPAGSIWRLFSPGIECRGETLIPATVGIFDAVGMTPQPPVRRADSGDVVARPVPVRQPTPATPAVARPLTPANVSAQETTAGDQSVPPAAPAVETAAVPEPAELAKSEPPESLPPSIAVLHPTTAALPSAPVSGGMSAEDTEARLRELRRKFGIEEKETS